MWLKSKTIIVTKLQNSNCDKTQKLKLWPNSKNQILTKLKNSNCDRTKKNQIVTKLKKSNCDGSNSDSSDSSRVTYLSQNNSTTCLVKTTWHLQNWWDFSGQLFAISRCFCNSHRLASAAASMNGERLSCFITTGFVEQPLAPSGLRTGALQDW